MFGQQHQYEGCLRETFEEFPKTAVNLLENLFSIDPEKRGTASSALMSEVRLTKTNLNVNQNLTKLHMYRF